ncbi:MAG TPA: Holliday junction resolvase RuvX [Clostridiales bacterium]|jgi:putative Holliday junction resolvase|nr:Holliday junction resolvase RuvX [Clostridiales bacterium]HBE13351.1 Holliday junction resolvase RuvX [Clostridiales bacterium]
MIIMGIDFGDARMGIAFCDEEERMAFAKETVKVTSLDQAAEEAVLKAKEEGARLLVVGMPRNMDGSLGPRAEKTWRFIALLQSKCELPVETVDERLTTMAAHTLLHEAGIKKGRSKGVVDALAAKLILESFMKRYKRE